MVRPARHKKPVNYSQFENSDSDDDFVPATAPLSKKSRTTQKELKLEKPEPKLKNLQEKDIPLQEKTPKKRMALDDKLYQRDLEVALALSVKELPTVTTDAEDCQDKSTDEHGSGNAETTVKSPHISNCSVASDYLDLDKITEEGDSRGARGRRKAASQATVQQRKILLDGSDGNGDGDSDSEPDFATGDDSEDDSDFCESEDDEALTVRKSKVKEIKKQKVKVKSPVEKKEKKPKSRRAAVVTSVDSAPSAVKSESQPLPKKVFVSSEATEKPLQICSPSAESRRPKWVPPAASGSGSSSRPLAGVAVKSPSQSLRLGLSRLARVKPLHPSAASSCV
ncbi:RAD51-associated protein 1 isoform X1 [Phacochoerus africanus]|uniref:RAD51-associated protein 1 isoform X1 n=1 Tax=Phacochoerus africanus TaxID=41426 RepID=UPI001FDA3BFF|nr:RAD51-associated protein 1 isoform X1 [Phacochoerus africanus]